MADLLEGLGIAVRRFSPKSVLSDMLRIGCPGEARAFERLERALRAALRPQAILVESFLGFLGLSVDEPSASWVWPEQNSESAT